MPAHPPRPPTCGARYRRGHRFFRSLRASGKRYANKRGRALVVNGGKYGALQARCAMAIVDEREAPRGAANFILHVKASGDLASQPDRWRSAAERPMGAAATRGRMFA